MVFYWLFYCLGVSRITSKFWSFQNTKYSKIIPKSTHVKEAFTYMWRMIVIWRNFMTLSINSITQFSQVSYLLCHTYYLLFYTITPDVIKTLKNEFLWPLNLHELSVPRCRVSSYQTANWSPVLICRKTWTANIWLHTDQLLHHMPFPLIIYVSSTINISSRTLNMKLFIMIIIKLKGNMIQ